MRIELEIPKEFEENFLADRFEEGLFRLSADANLLAGNYERETATMLIKALSNAKIVDGEKWIPCHKRKPIGREDVLIKFWKNICTGHYVKKIGCWAIKTTEGSYCVVGEDEEQPVAWKPFPKEDM